MGTPRLVTCEGGLRSASTVIAGAIAAGDGGLFCQRTLKSYLEFDDIPRRVDAANFPQHAHPYSNHITRIGNSYKGPRPVFQFVHSYNTIEKRSYTGYHLHNNALMTHADADAAAALSIGISSTGAAPSPSSSILQPSFSDAKGFLSPSTVTLPPLILLSRNFSATSRI